MTFRAVQRCFWFAVPIAVVVSAFLGGMWIFDHWLHAAPGALGVALWPAFMLGIVSRKLERATGMAVAACLVATILSLFEASLSNSIRSSYGPDWRHWLLIHAVIAAVSLQMWYAGHLWPAKNRLPLHPCR